MQSRCTSLPTRAFVDEVVTMADQLGVESWTAQWGVLVRIDLVGRRQCVAVLRHEGHIECLSLADTEVGEQRVMEAFAHNAEPGVAGLMLLRDARGEERIVARAANLAETLHESELRRLLLETGRRADAWEARHHGADQW